MINESNNRRLKYQEFIALKAKYESKRENLLWLILGVASIEIFVFLVIAIVYPETPGLSFLLVFAFIAILCIALIVLHFEKTAAIKSGLVCPYCNKTFSGGDIRIVTVTRHCPYCEQQVYSAENEP